MRTGTTGISMLLGCAVLAGGATAATPEDMLAAYRAADLWSRRPDLPPAAFLRLKAALVSGGLIHRDPSYEHVVDADLYHAS